MNAEYRRLMSEKYSKLTKEEKPHIQICDLCQQPLYKEKVCSESGLFHTKTNQNTREICGIAVDKDQRCITGAQLTEFMKILRIKWEPARIQKVKIDQDAISMFQSFATLRSWRLHRIGVLYGKICENDTAIEIHGIYEPEQENTEISTKLSADSRTCQVDTIASLFGLQRLGIIIAHGFREKSEVVMTAEETLLGLKESSRFGDLCIVVTVSPKKDSAECEVEVWQASQQGVHLYRLGYFHCSNQSTGLIHSSKPLEVAEAQKSGSGRPSMVSKAPSHEIDCRWLISPVAVEPFHSSLFRNRFVRISRPGEESPTILHLARCFADQKYRDKPFLYKVADFHILIFLAEFILDLKNDIPVLVNAILTKDSVAASGIEYLIKAYLENVSL